MSKLRILIADDHEVVRQGVRALVQSRPGWEVCGEATHGRQAVEQAAALKPDLVIMDVGMPGLNGVDAARHIIAASPTIEILLLTMHDSEPLMREALEAGIRGYLLKSDAGRDLVQAVDALSRHQPYFTGRISEMILEGYLRANGNTAGEMMPNRLTPREREILQLLAEGKSNKEVANALKISVSTAETHRTNIMRKLSVHSLADLVHYAIRNKLIEV